MKYSLNLELYRESFSVPNSVVEQHLKLAGALQLKVLLWICAHKGLCADIKAIANDLGANCSDVQDSLQYWICNNVIQTMENADDFVPEVKETTQSSPFAPVAVPSKTMEKLAKPTRQEVARRSTESQEISWFMGEAQKSFNRTLNFSETSTFVWLIDTYGMEPGILLMVLEYAKTVDKLNIKYIQKTAIDWVNQEIDTVKKAEDYLTHLELARTDWNTISRLFGMKQRKASPTEETMIHRWLHVWNFSIEMIQRAYDACVNNVGEIKFQYINKVLNAWFDSNIKTPEQIDTNAPKPQKKGLKKASQSKTTSYDIKQLDELI